MRLAWVASAAVHAGAAAWLAFAIVRDEPARPHPRSPSPSLVQPVHRPDAAPIDVILLDGAGLPSGRIGVAYRPLALGRDRDRAASSSGREVAPSHALPGESSSSSSALPPSSLIRMRPLDLSAPADVLRPGAVAYSPPELSGRLEWHADGHGVIRDRVTTVHVDPDGVAHFKDKPDIEIDSPLAHLDTWRNLPSELQEAPGALHDALRGWYQDVQAQNEYLAHYDRRQHLAEIPNGCADYAELNCIDPDLPPGPKQSPIPSDGALISGTADISAWLQRKFVGDPYASRKKKLLEDTFVERAAHGETYRAGQLARSAEEMQTNLEHLWATTRDVAGRRAALFDLWDECAEGDDPLGAAGQRARDLVLVWIRAKLPAGSSDAYTPDELAALAKRKHSAQAFEPYASR